jgi:hypothetical protein
VLLIHMSYFGFCGDRDVMACSLRCESPPTLEITSVNSLGESGLDGEVETCVVIICQLAHVGTFVEAVCQGRVRFGRYNRHAVGEMSSGSGGEENDGSGGIADSEFGRPAIIDNHDMPKVIFGVMPPLQDGFSIKGDFTTCFVENYLAPCVAQDGNG